MARIGSALKWLRGARRSAPDGRRSIAVLSAGSAPGRPLRAGRPRILLVQPNPNPPGGGSGVAAWMLQALVAECDVVLLTRAALDLERIDRFYGTSLRNAAFQPRQARSRVLEAISRPPLRLALLNHVPLARAARRLDAECPFDLLISADNEFDFGRRGVQYVHFPWLFTRRPATGLRGRLEWISRLYRRFAHRLAGVRPECLPANRTLVNSAYIARRFRDCYGLEAEVLHPPVAAAGVGGDRPWAQRRNGFLCVGRLAPDKELEKVIAIVEALRGRGHGVSLTLLGSWDMRGASRRRLASRIERNRAWLTLREDVSRPELLESMAAQRYGIHGMKGEHFGMAVAEMQRSGCLVFAPEDGGPAEILGGEERLLYRDAEDAIGKIDSVLRDESLQDELRSRARLRSADFDVERFVERFVEIVREELDPCVVAPRPEHPSG